MKRIRPIDWPIQNGFNGPGGRFVKGNPGGTGNPFARRTAKLREAVLREVRPKDIRRILRRLIRMAVHGDVAAAKVLFDRALGRTQLDIDIVRLTLEVPDPDERFL